MVEHGYHCQWLPSENQTWLAQMLVMMVYSLRSTIHGIFICHMFKCFLIMAMIMAMIIAICSNMMFKLFAMSISKNISSNVGYVGQYSWFFPLFS